MTEQQLLDYEGTRYIIESIVEELRVFNSKLFGCSSINLQRVGSRSAYRDRLTDAIVRKDELNQEYKEAKEEYEAVVSNYKKALSILNKEEREYCQKRYIEAKLNRVIANEMHISLRNVYYIRKGILDKIKNV